jgi:hypothetical protein
MEWLFRIIGVKLTRLFAESSMELELDHEAYKVSEIITSHLQHKYRLR